MLTIQQWKEWFDFRVQFDLDTTGGEPEDTKTYLEIFADIFSITTYDSHKNRYFGEKILEVLDAIATGRVRDYQDQSDAHYTDYLMVCNFKYVAPLLDWGTSIRGAWMDPPQGGWALEEWMGNYHPAQGLQPVLHTRAEMYDFIINAVELIKYQEASLAAEQNPDLPMLPPEQWAQNNRRLTTVVNGISESLSTLFMGFEEPLAYTQIEQEVRKLVDVELPKLVVDQPDAFASYTLDDVVNGNPPPPWTLSITAYGQTGYITIG